MRYQPATPNNIKNKKKSYSPILSVILRKLSKLISINLLNPFFKRSVFASKEFDDPNDLEIEVDLGGPSVIGLLPDALSFLSIFHSVMFGRMLVCGWVGGASVGTAATAVAVKNLLMLNRNVR